MYKDKACGPTWNMLSTCIKYGLQQFVINAIEAGEFCLIGKKVVRTLFEVHYVKRWTAAIALDQNFLETIWLNDFFFFSHMANIVARLLAN
jgi:hypothetical protein